MNVTLPNGKTIEGIPDGTSKEEIKQKAIASGLITMEEFEGAIQQPIDPGLTPPIDPLEGKNALEKFVIGAGSGMVDLGQGVAQTLGADNLDAIKEKKLIDESGGLNDSTAGTIGNITGKMALAAPAMFIPGANTAVGATAIGAGLGLAEPVADENIIEGKIKNAGYGAAFGLGGHEVGKRVGGYLAGRYADKAQKNAIQESAKATQVDTLAQGKNLGYRVNPTQANPSKLNRGLEGWAGKITTAQSVAEYNQGVTNSIARRSIGLADDTPLTPEVLKSVRDSQGQVYKQISDITERFKADDQYLSDLDDITRNVLELAEDFPDFKGADSQIEALINSVLADDMSAKSAVEVVKRLRNQATTHFKNADDPAIRALAFAEKKAANALDALIGRNLDNLDMGGLHQSWHKAREVIAKTHTIERALNEGAGNVTAHKLARAYSKGDPLSGELKDAAKFAQTFDRATQEIKSSMPGISPLDVAATTMGAGTGSWKAIGAAMMARPLARGLITSGPYQKAMTQPKYPNYVNLIEQMKKLPTAAGIAAPSVYFGQQ